MSRLPQCENCTWFEPSHGHRWRGGFCTYPQIMLPAFVRPQTDRDVHAHDSCGRFFDRAEQINPLGEKP